MSEFSTCFPASKSISNENFLSMAILWLNGVKASKVLADRSLSEMHDDEAFIESGDGEKLRFKKLNGMDHSAIGLQHEYQIKKAGSGEQNV